jgi:hypothetical protein
MGKRRWILEPVIAAALGGATVFFASSCGEAAAPATPNAESRTAGWPAGGPVPAELRGDWFMPPSAVEAVSGVPCPTPATTLNCFFQLTFEGTTYRQTFSATGGKQEAGQGNVVVKNNEIDFFNGVICGLKLPDGVGRYRWAITAGVLQFTLISDPCTRWEVYTHQGWTRALVAERILRGLDSRDLTSPVRANGGACTRTPQPAKRRRRY